MCYFVNVLFALILFAAPTTPAPRPAFPTDFSASIVDYVPPYPAKVQRVGRMFVSKGRLRLENYEERSTSMITLVDPSSGHTWGLMPQGKLALDFSAQAEEMRHSFGVSASAEHLDPINLQAPCAEFERVTCRNLGTEIVNGRSTQKWEFTQVFGTHSSKSFQWIDPKLLIAIKLEDRRSGRQVIDIKEGPQPEALFHIPADYQKH